MSAWSPHPYSNIEVDKAVRALLDKGVSQLEYQKNVKIFDDWRSCYAHPLLGTYVHTHNKAVEIESDCIVSQRLKRKESIFAKIERFPDMRASRMQDIGGCRIVFKNITSVYKLRDKLKNSRRKHILQNEKDYIANPKNSGYRGIHLVYRYNEGKEHADNYILIETQIRTRLQHLWATSVEAMSYFTQKPLKSSMGPDEWLRFFSLVSSLFAVEEKQPIVPGTPASREETVSEIQVLNDRHHFFDQLRAYNIAARHISTKEGYYYVLVLKLREQIISITSFRKDQISDATEMYNNYENAEPDNNVVLVSADSVNNLKKAYPNYFMDTKEFVETLTRLLKK
jgi:ppGpp synthetase/RelA/SpoT-type nucleotidyltranferase